jgi:hypothetical protein
MKIHRNNISDSNDCHCLRDPIGTTGPIEPIDAVDPISSVSPISPCSMVNYAYIYSTCGQLVPDNAPIVWTSPSTTAPILNQTGTPTVILSGCSVYLVRFCISVRAGNGSQFSIVIDDETQPSLTYNNRSGDTQIYGEAIINVTSKVSRLEIRNVTGEAIVLSNGLGVSTNPNTSVSATLVIFKLK